MSNLEGKRLLILGAFEHSKHLIYTAKKLGVYTIVTDYVKDAPAKKYADKSYDISTLDVDLLVDLCKKEKVDGVIAGYCDVNLSPYYNVCKIMGFPYYCDDKQLDITMNKKNFKNLCIKHGISVAKDIDEKLIKECPEQITYPVIVKPADSYSSKGISVCHNAEMLPEALEKAMSVSTCKQIVVEEFIEAEDVYLYFTVQDGVVSLSAMADRLLNNEQYGSAPQPVGYFFPSKYLDLYLNKIHSKVQSMVKETGLKNCSFFMQGFAKDNDIIFFEMGLRLSGGCGYIQIRNQNEIDQTEMYVNYALTGKFGPWKLSEYDNPRFKKPACVIVVLLNNGTIGEIKGLQKIYEDQSFVDILQLKHQGDVLDAKGTLNQVFARIYLCNNSKTELQNSIKNLKDNIRITDINGKNMIMNLFNEDDVY